MQNIPASQIVAVTPSVIGAGGSALDLIGLVLTNSTRVPIGTVASFPTARAVSDYFGPSSDEKDVADIYFLGFDNSNKKPGAVLFAQYPAAAVAAYLRGGEIGTMTLTSLQAIHGPLSVTVDGVVSAAGTVNLAAASSFSSAAGIISTALSELVTYDSVSGAFVITSGSTGSASSITFATGSIAGTLKLTSATGAVLSQGDVAGVPETNLDAITNLTQDWATFMTVWEPDTDNKVAFAAWTTAQVNRYAYIMWDTDEVPTQSTDTVSAGYQIRTNEDSGTVCIYSPDFTLAAFICGAIASLDFDQTNGRATMAFRAQAGIAASVTDATVAANLIAHGYNFYGNYSTANDSFTFFYPGSISGDYLWIDSYINQIWLNNAFQLALMSLLVAMKSIPYNAAGYGLITAACLDPINQALNFGAIRGGVPLSAAQAAEVNNAAGVRIDNVLNTRGWYLQVKDATAQVRAARASPPCLFFYMDGGSVQKINLASIEIQ